jgi:FtsH-binding integral membrane protein
MASLAEHKIRVDNDSKFFTGLAVALSVTAFLGFAPTYYLMGAMHAKPLPMLVHLHGIACTTWLLLLLTQTGLVMAGRRDLHRKLGLSALAVASVIIVLGLMVAFHAARSGRVNPGPFPPPTLLFYQFMTLGTFGIFVLLGIANRADAAAHKRLMMLASMALVLPALARIARMIQTAPLPANANGGSILSNLFLIALAAYDWKSRGRLHRVTLWGGLAFVAAEAVRPIVGLSEPWQRFASGLIGV